MRPNILSTILALLVITGLAQATPKIPLDKLYSMELEDVPEKIIVTDMLDPYGRLTVDGLLHILDKHPEDWEYVGKGKISVSDQYSRAGAKSIRWDWKAGDVIRIKDIGVFSNLRVPNGSETWVPFEFHIFQENPLPKNTQFNLYFKRSTDHRNGKNELKLIRMHYFMNFAGTWYKMGGKQVKGSDFGRKDHVNVIDAMPKGIPAPQENEIILQAPTDVKSGTFYLDRIVAPAKLPTKGMADGGLKKYLDLTFTSTGALIDERAYPFALTSEPDIATIGILDKQIDPTSYNQTRPGYYGYNSQKPPVPTTLTKEQQNYVKELRESFFAAPKPLKPEDAKYKAIESQAKKILQRNCVQLPNGKYKYKETINYSGTRLFLKGDLYSYRKHLHHLPKFENKKDIAQHDVKHLFLEYAKWYSTCPDSKPVEHLFKAYLDWFQYQVSIPLLDTVHLTGHEAKYGGAWLLDTARKAIAVLRAKGQKDDLAYAKYIGDIAIWMSKIQTYTFAVDPLPGISREWSAESTYDGLFYEQDDKKFYQMLKASQEAFTRTLSISVVNRRGMIKPDYTYFHHGHCSYWGGNYFAHMKKAEQFNKTILDFDPTIKRNLAWYTTRYCFGPYGAMGPVKGGQGSGSKYTGLRHKLKTNPKRIKRDLTKPSPFIILPRDTVFDYFYHMDWKEIPAVKKYLAGVIGMAKHHPKEVLENLYAKYPKLKVVTPQTDIHMSINWSGCSSYNRGLARVYVGSFSDKDNTPSRPNARWSWNRGYGCLYIIENDDKSNLALGLSTEGYEWSKPPGITMPSVTNADYMKHEKENLIGKGSASSHGNGSVTFNETEEKFGKYGNYSFLTTPDDNTKLWKMLGVEGLQGRKSYHFYKDKVVCLGSNYQANTSRPMETVLFQNGVNDVIWKNKNMRRWNPDKPSIIVNGKKHEGRFSVDIPLAKPNYVISPYGHAWLIPGNQKGNLKVHWQEQETLFKWRISATGLNPGQKMTKGDMTLATLNHGASTESSSHHYCVLLNSDGKSLNELDQCAKETLKNLNYSVLKRDEAAHAIRFNGDKKENDLYSYIVYQGNKPLGLPWISSTNKRLNLMMQQNRDGDLVLSACDPFIDIEKDKQSPTHEQSRTRKVTITFAKGMTPKILSSRSGLPQTNPPLNAKIDGDILTYTTRNGVSDTFVIKMH